MNVRGGAERHMVGTHENGARAFCRKPVGKQAVFLRQRRALGRVLRNSICGHTHFLRSPEQCRRRIEISGEQNNEPAGKHVIEARAAARTDDPGLRTRLSGAR